MSLKQLAGFKEDCQELIKKFSATNSLTFNKFASIWCDMKFSFIFFGQRPLGLMRQFTEDVLIIAKHYWLKSEKLCESIAGLYLLYGLYFKNRLPGLIQIPLTFKEMELVSDFAKNMTDSSHNDPSFILQKLFDNEAFYFSACTYSYGMERPYRLQTYHPSHLPKLETFSNDHSDLKEFISVYNQYLESKRDIVGVVEDLSLSKTFLSQILPDFKYLSDSFTDVPNISKNVASSPKNSSSVRIFSENKRKKTNKESSVCTNDFSATVVLDFPDSSNDNESNESYIITNEESVDFASTLGASDAIGLKGKEATKTSKNKSERPSYAQVKSGGVEKSKILNEEISDLLKTLDCASTSHSFEELSTQKTTKTSDFSWIFKDDNDFE